MDQVGRDKRWCLQLNLLKFPKLSCGWQLEEEEGPGGQERGGILEVKAHKNKTHAVPQNLGVESLPRVPNVNQNSAIDYQLPGFPDHTIVQAAGCEEMSKWQMSVQLQDSEDVQIRSAVLAIDDRYRDL